MFTDTFRMSSFYLLFLYPSLVTAGLSDKWDQCNCRFGDWKEWSKCSRQCAGGTQMRARWVWWTTNRGCNKFTDCATNDLGFEYRNCNEICYNGGTYHYSYCSCPLGWKGSCCEEEVTCGDPGSITNGRRHVSSYSYGSTVRYVCYTHYRMVGKRTQKCNSAGFWSGNKPRCVFANTCQSNPCQNGGTCVNYLERYDCNCLRGWSGLNCELDVQPPVLTGCPSDITKYIATPTVTVNWTEPSFNDPMNTQLQISRNYPQNLWEFPWGDYQVQYVATKSVNGLRTECVFNIKIRPHPCRPLNEPEEHTAKVCSNWMTDYGQYCLVFCDKSFTLVDEGDYDNWYVCGASGRWIPSQSVPPCSRFFDANAMNTRDQFHYENCSDATSIDHMKDVFITRMRTSPFSYFCRTYDDQCSTANVTVTCR